MQGLHCRHLIPLNGFVNFQGFVYTHSTKQPDMLVSLPLDISVNASLQVIEYKCYLSSHPESLLASKTGQWLGSISWLHLLLRSWGCIEVNLLLGWKNLIRLDCKSNVFSQEPSQLLMPRCFTSFWLQVLFTLVVLGCLLCLPRITICVLWKYFDLFDE